MTENRTTNMNRSTTEWAEPEQNEYRLPEGYGVTSADIRLAHVNLQRALRSTADTIKRRRKKGGQDKLIASFFEPVRHDLAAFEAILYTAAADAFARRRDADEQGARGVTQ